MSIGPSQLQCLRATPTSSPGDDHIPALLVYNGYGICKAIFVGDDTPGAIFPYTAGHLRQQGVMVGMG